MTWVEGLEWIGMLLMLTLAITASLISYREYREDDDEPLG